MLRRQALEPANCEKPLHNQTLVGCEKPSANSFQEHSLRLECRQERDMPVNKAMGDNVKTEMQTPACVLSSLGTSEIP
jgi:hypothetical protein